MEKERDSRTLLEIDKVNQVYYSGINAFYNRYAEMNHISGKYLMIISLLYTRSARTQKELCAYSADTKQSVNRIITDLFSKGYVTLTPDPIDRREKMIELTDSGIEYIGQISDPLYAIKVNVMEKMGEERVKDLKELLTQYSLCLRESLPE